MNTKGIMIILDGLGDCPQTALNGMTPLEAARTPNLDHLLEKGQCGLVHPISPGIPVGTQTGTGLLFGLPPHEIHKLTRGTVEAAGVGMMVQPGDVALRCNFATVKKDEHGWEIIDRRAGRIREGRKELAEALDGLDLGNGITSSFRAATQHRAILKLSGPGLSAKISDTDPGSAARPARVLESYGLNKVESSSVKTAEALNRFFVQSTQILKEHPVNLARMAEGRQPANGIISRGAGMVRNVQSIINKMGLVASVIAGEHTLLGLSSLFGFKTITSEHFTSLSDTDLDGKVLAATEALKQSNLVFLHIKATDIFAHDLNPLGKRDFIEKVDTSLKYLLKEDLVIGITADHSTDSRTGNHTGDPVPTILASPHGRRDTVSSYGEIQCTKGGLGQITANEYLHCLLNTMGHPVPLTAI